MTGTELPSILQNRLEANMNRREGMEWAAVVAILKPAGTAAKGKNRTGKDKDDGETEDDGPGFSKIQGGGQEIRLCNGI